jgi:hypothetical protein
MFNLRRSFLKTLLCIALTAVCACGQTNVPPTTGLTQILDNITNPDGTPFNGTVVVTWNGFSSSGSGPVSRLSASVPVYNGALTVTLIPTTTAPSGTYYVAVYNSTDGSVSWSEVWQVPPSATPLNLSAVRQSSTEGSGSSGPPPTGGVQYATLPIAIAQVTDLSADLASLNLQLTTLAATVTTLGAGASSILFIDAETPAGAINSLNSTFSLTQAPAPASSLSVYENGLLLLSAVDFSLAGASITFATGHLPQTGDTLEAYYRVPGAAGPAPSFADGETPGGAVNGANATFTLAAAPNPAGSLKLSNNGVLLMPVHDFTLAGATITFVAGAIPQAGDLLQAAYRH